MNLKDFLAQRDKPPELYWSLVLEEGWIQTGVWYIGAKTAEIVTTSPPTPWEVETELVGAADTALSSAIQKLPEEYPEPSKTVFGVPSGWVKEGEIVSEKLEFIKKLCGELSLTPVGFVVLPEAIAHLFKTEEGSPVSAIIIGLGKESLEISVFKMGNLAGSTNVARSVSLTDDITEGLSRFDGAGPLPSRLILFDGKGAELEEAKQILMQETWEDSKVKFLHTPKVEILDSDRKVFATSLAGANEIGDVSQINSNSAEEPEESLPLQEEVENVSEPTESVNPEDLGFTVGEDVSLTKTVEESPKEEVQESVPEQKPVVPVVTHPLIHKPQLNVNVNDYMEKTKTLFNNFSKKIHIPAPPHIGSPKKQTRVFGAIAGVAFLALFLFWWFAPRAEITIFVTPKSYQENLGIFLSTDGVSNLSEMTIPATYLEEKILGEKTSGVTGSKTVGDKAKGEIEVQNGTAFPINLPSGSTITSSSNLKFITQSAASVSAALSPTSPGKATISVEADTIGAQFNLAKGEVFKVGNYPKAEVDGTSTGDFTGGSSRTISAVSDADLKNLSNELKEELKSGALTKLEEKSGDGQYFINDLILFEVDSENFDAKVGDEADSLKLNLAMNARALTVDKTKLNEFAGSVLQNKVPQGFVLRDNQVTYGFTYEEGEDGKLRYKLALTANFLPQTDLESIKKQIAGKTPDAAESYLSKIPGFTRAEVTLKPNFGPLGLIPRVKDNLTIEISSER